LLKHSIFFICLCATAFTASAQVQSFPLQSVKLTNSTFKNAQDVDLKYILALNADKLLAPYLIDAGLPLKAERYGNWESSGLDGHIGGHYLSALAMMYASTKNAELKTRLDYMVSELARCQTKNGNGYVGGIPQGKVFWERIHKGDIDGSSFGLNNTWVPLYNIHKLFAGLRDAYQFANNKQALQVLIGLGDWFSDLIKPLSEEQIQTMLRTEHGGMNEVFADLYEITKDKKYLQIAERISHKAILNPLIQHQDKLTGLHANTQIPKVIGFEKIGQLNGNKDWSDAAVYFWNNLTKKRSVAFGGNSVREHFNPTNDFSKMLESNQGPETCNSYNMLRLSKALYLDKNDLQYLDFYEKTLYNHILSSQHPQHGGFVYFTPIRPRHYRVYSQPETSMWCCVGSGLENHTKYGELIYSHNQQDLFVNLFIPSIVNWAERDMKLTQKTQFPYSNRSELIVNIKKPNQFNIGIRFPKWASEVKVWVNDKNQTFPAKSGEYILINRNWKNGDKILVELPMKTHLEYLPDSSNWAAIMHGPIVLAAKTDTTNLDGLFADDSRMGHEAKGKLYSLESAIALVDDNKEFLGKIKPSKNQKFRFSMNDLIQNPDFKNLQLMPFFELHDARYQMYFQTLNSVEFQKNAEKLKTQETQILALEANTVDKINCGEQQPEVDHNYKGEKSDAGYEEGRFWRNTKSFISYQFSNKNLEGKYVEIAVLDNLKIENLYFLLNGKPLEIISTERKIIKLKIPETEQLSKNLVLKISTNNGVYSPRIHQIRLTTKP
jgi:DUF1680 family protein